MSDVQIVLNDAGIKELLKSKEVVEVCREHGERALGVAGEHYTMQDRNYPERSGVAIMAVDYQGMRDNLTNNTLVKALGS